MSNSSVPYYQCTLSTCPISDAQVHYVPTLFGNAFYIAIFTLILGLQIFQGIRYRTWTLLFTMIGGLALEIIGYGSRIQMHYNPFLFNPFLIYLICLTIAPTFFSAAIYLCLARIVVVYGEEHSRFRPRTYTLTFIICDIISLVLQAAGGALADLAATPEQGRTGVHVMVAGLSFQVASLALFAILCADFAWTARKNRGVRPSIQGRTFKLFIFSLIFATVFIFIRSCFRVAELSGGFGSALANDQITFMILEGAMIVSACLCLTLFHPGRAFAGGWKSAGYTLRAGGEKS
ncbi:related to RTA1 domain protein [Phialocephala subalpina]|uniref:Related to RTA1 domain protein n=1 Tax=Phialocephala subalpina TaxID=576137 RepID=A0A1L7WBU2_9HELO|nr:related to RTA1 domain protein [Phialocephala subalpina]